MLKHWFVVIGVSDCFRLCRMLDNDLAHDALPSLSVSDSPLREVLSPSSSQPLQLFLVFVFAYMPARGISLKHDWPRPFVQPGLMIGFPFTTFLGFTSVRETLRDVFVSPVAITLLIFSLYTQTPFTHSCMWCAYFNILSDFLCQIYRKSCS